MADIHKKAAAALAAVSAYLQEEEAARQASAAPVEFTGLRGVEFSQWSQSGRQEMMAMRRLVQLRVFGRLR